MIVRKEKVANGEKEGLDGGVKCGWEIFLQERTPLMVVRSCAVAVARRRACEQDWNVEGVKQFLCRCSRAKTSKLIRTRAVEADRNRSSSSGVCKDSVGTQGPMGSTSRVT